MTDAQYPKSFLEEVQAFIERQGVAWGKPVRDMLHAEMSRALAAGKLREWYATANA